MTLLIVQFML